MAWRRPGAKPLSETKDGKFTDAYMRHSVSMSYMYGFMIDMCVCMCVCMWGICWFSGF